MEGLEDRTAPATFVVTLPTDTGDIDSSVTPFGTGTAGDLRNAIYQSLQDSTDDDIIDLSGLSGTIDLSAMLPPIYTTGGGSLTIIGPGAGNLTISGGGAVRPFFILGGDISISDLTIANGLAQGGDGGSGAGGGAGMGGGLLIDGTLGTTIVTLTNVTFDMNQAIGGDGGSGVLGGGGGAGGNGGEGFPFSGGGAGGGFYGNGGAATTGVGGGGGGFTGAGGNGTSNGSDIGGGGGGAGGTGSSGGGNGNSTTGVGGGGGINISGFPIQSTGTANGGFGGGGGGGGTTSGTSVSGGSGGDYGGGGSEASGGFGGGGGWGAAGAGSGGFGGGGGGWQGGIGGPGSGNGGGGNGAQNVGGGGAGLGGAVFQRAGTLELRGVSFTNNSAVGGGGAAFSGSGIGGAIYVYSGATAYVLGTTSTFSGNTANSDADIAGELTLPALSVTAGTPQNAFINTDFATPLEVTLQDALGNPVPGVTVTFAAPITGASAILSAPSAVTDANGRASVMATANGIAGSYTISVSTFGITSDLSFSLTNSVPSVLTVIAGSPQSTSVNTAFGTPLVMTVTDSFGNPVPGATVTFAVPNSGASATLSSTTVVTASTGLAIVTATANGTAGSYAVTASVGSLNVTFNLTNGQTTDVTPKQLVTKATSRKVLNIGSKASVALKIAVPAGQLNGAETVASLFNNAPVTISIQKADGSVVYGTVTATAKVKGRSRITVSLKMDDALRSLLYDASENGGAVKFGIVSTANGGNYTIDTSTMSRLVNKGPNRYVP